MCEKAEEIFGEMCDQMANQSNYGEFHVPQISQHTNELVS